MLANLEALIALSRAGTMTRAALDLRITQSAVSKRIATLESSLGLKLVEPAGRRVRLTADAARLIQSAAPLVGELRSLMLAERSELQGTLVLGVSESVLASWGPPLLAAVQRRIPGLTLELNAHRSPVAIDRVRAGEYMLALVAGQSDAAPDLVTDVVMEEEMVIVPRGLRRSGLELSGEVRVTSIEAESATWSAVRRRLGALRRQAGVTVVLDDTLQSFACIVQMARAGLCHGLVPMGIAEALAVPRDTLARFPAPGLTRPVSLVGRQATLGRPLVAAFRQAVIAETDVARDPEQGDGDTRTFRTF